MKITRYLTVTVCILIMGYIMAGSELFGQTYKYTYEYDNCGNRVKRLSEIELGSSTLNPESIAGESTTEKSSLADEYAREFISGHEILLYPNPTDGILEIKLIEYSSEITGEIVLLGLDGKVIYKQKILESFMSVDLSQQISGAYLLHVTINSETRVYRIIKK